MRYLGDNYLTRVTFAALALGVLIVGIISIAAMNHNGMMLSQNCPVAVQSGDCSQPIESNVCIDYHLGIIQNISNAIPQNFGVGLLGLIFFAFLALVAFGLLSSQYSYYHRLKVRLRQLLEKTIFVFQNQLGFWLAIIQKKDPSYAFVLA